MPYAYLLWCCLTICYGKGSCECPYNLSVRQFAAFSLKVEQETEYLVRISVENSRRITFNRSVDVDHRAKKFLCRYYFVLLSNLVQLHKFLSRSCQHPHSRYELIGIAIPENNFCFWTPLPAEQHAARIQDCAKFCSTFFYIYFAANLCTQNGSQTFRYKLA